jgi:acetyltransferase EpsM
MVYILGAGRHAAETYQLYNEELQNPIQAFLEDNCTDKGKKLYEIPVLDSSFLEELLKKPNNNIENIKLLCAIGSPKRKLWIERINKLYTWQYDTIISKNVLYQPQNVEILEGTTIAQGCILTVNISIGKHSIINIGCTISHDCKIGNFVTISPAVKIAGNVIIEDEVFIGIGATIIDKITIGKGSFIAAGAVVTKNVAPYSMVGGVPAKYLKNWNNE